MVIIVVITIIIEMITASRLTKKLIKICNKILVNREDDCNCFDSKNNPIK